MKIKNILFLLFLLFLLIIVFVRYKNSDLYVENKIEEYNKEIEKLNNEERFLGDEEIEKLLKNINKTLQSQIDYDYNRQYYDFQKEKFPLESSSLGHMWSFGSNVRQESSRMKIFTNMGIIYIGKEKYNRTPVKFSPKSVSLFETIIEPSATEIFFCLIETSELENEKIKYFGKENIDNIDTIIVGGNCNMRHINYEVKLWLWEEKGIAIRSEIIEKANDNNNYSEPLRILYEFKNIKFKEFNKDIFKIQENEIYKENETNFSDSALKNYIDSDKDGLIDFVEINVFHTNPENPDTDGDGFSDGDEVEGAYNPIGTGRIYSGMYKIISNNQ